MIPSLQIQLFGPPAIHVAGLPLPRLKTRKGLWLLALLALRHGRDVDRTWLAGTLWPDTEEPTALTYLRQTLTDLRKAMGSAAVCLQASGTRSLCLDLRDAQFDVRDFDDLIGRGSPEALESAVNLVTGPLLEGCSEEWVLQERESRTQAWLHALESLAAYYVEQGNPSAAVRLLLQVTAAEPLRESAHQDLMRALAALGETAASLRVYRDLRLILRRELNAEPDPSTTLIFEQIRSDAKRRAAVTADNSAVFAAAPVVASVRELASAAPRVLSEIRRSVEYRLPRFVSPFLGRDRELDDLKRHLATSSLLTLTGVGGVGKTRLAIRIAEESAGSFSHGTAFVDFSPLSESALVPDLVATGLGISERASRPRAGAISDLLEHREMLLVLDNCEHVLVACAELAADLLKQCPRLKIIATSRQRLRIDGETEWRVQPLEVPAEHSPEGNSEDGELLRSSDAIALFMDRAVRVRPDLKRDLSTLRKAAEICRRLDGLPLALELAAARLQALSMTQLADRIEERFKLLVAGDTTAPGRQQTLRATLDWSYDLLAEPERQLFRRLSVFAGGWTLEAAEAVCADDSLEHADVLNALSSLVDKSLVVFTDEADKARYTMLETMRQYAREKLIRSGEEAALRDRHRDYLVAVAEEAAPLTYGETQSECFDRLEIEHDNLRAALDWCAESPDSARVGMRLAGSLHRFWGRRAHCAEGRRRYTELLRLDQSAEPSPERALAIYGLGYMEARLGDYAATRRYYDQSLEIWQQLRNATEIAQMTTYVAEIAYFQGDYDCARSLASRGLELNRYVGNLRGISLSLQLLGNIAFMDGNRAAAHDCFEQGLAACRAIRDGSIESVIQTSLGFLADSEGDLTAARTHFELALVNHQRNGDVSHQMIGMNNLGNLCRKLQDPALSADYYRAGLQLAIDMPGQRNPRIVSCLIEGAGILTLDRGDPKQAAWLLAAGDSMRAKIGLPRPYQGDAFEEFVHGARAQLDEASFNAAWKAGREADDESAIEEALAAVKVIGDHFPLTASEVEIALPLSG